MHINVALTRLTYNLKFVFNLLFLCENLIMSCYNSLLYLLRIGNSSSSLTVKNIITEKLTTLLLFLKKAWIVRRLIKINKTVNWLNVKKLSLNTAKTKFILFTPKKNEKTKHDLKKITMLLNR